MNTFDLIVFSIFDSKSEFHIEDIKNWNTVSCVGIDFFFGDTFKPIVRVEWEIFVACGANAQLYLKFLV